jgi:hypothetical protein
MSSTTSALASPAASRGRTIERSIEIDASPVAVWAALTDTSAYAEWNPFMSKLEGELTAGAKLEVRIGPPGARPMSFKPTVLAAEPERELRWIGHFIVPGLIDGEHSLLLEPLPGGRTRFTQMECFTGLLVRPLQSMLGKTQLGFEQMNAALKARAEAAGV